MAKDFLRSQLADLINNETISLEDLQQLVEGVQEGETSVEDFKDLLNGLDSIWTRIESSVLDSGRLTRERISMLSKKLDRAKGRQPDYDGLKPKSSYKWLLPEGPFKTSKELVEHTKAIYEINQTIEERWLPSAIECSKAYMEVITTNTWKDNFTAIDLFDWLKYEDRLKRVEKAFEQLDVDSLLKVCNSKDYVSSFKGKTRVSPLLGNGRVLHLKGPEEILEAKVNDVNEIRRHRKVLFDVSKLRDFEGVEVPETVPTLTWDECHELLGIMEAYAKNYKEIVFNGDYKTLINFTKDFLALKWAKKTITTVLTERSRAMQWIAYMPQNQAVFPYIEFGMFMTNYNSALMDLISQSLDEMK